MNISPSKSPATRLRTLVLLVLLFGMGGVLAELLLIEHHETNTMWIPLVMLALGAVVVLFRIVSPTRTADRAMAIVMSAFVISGVLGLWFHIDGNRQFELEIYPSMGGFELFWESMTGATPALAPGTMVLLGLIGLVVSVAVPQTNKETS
jgi:uncharacterized membrane protein HdeD (DUF308 family)